jgi:hypothetical protein
MSEPGWLLVSFYFAGPVGRRDVEGWSHLVGTADWINHSVLMHEELVEGMRVLSSRGLLEERRGAIRLTRNARRALTMAYGKRKRMSVFKLWDAGEALIARQAPCPMRVRPVTPAFFARAVEAYLKRSDVRKEGTDQ